MPFDTAKIPNKVIQAAQQRTLIPLIGAGISKQASAAFPTWNELLVSLLQHERDDDLISTQDADEMTNLLRQGRFLMVAEALRSSLQPDEMESFLQEKFKLRGVAPTEAHRLIFELRSPIILTTNYDTLLEDAYAKFFSLAPTIYTYRHAPLIQRILHTARFLERPIIFKVHGSIDEPSELILTERDYRNLLYDQPGYRQIMSAIFLSHVVLMLGFSASDREIMLLLESIRHALKDRSNPDFIFLPDESTGTVERKRLREDFGIQAISYSPSPGHPEVLEFFQELCKHVPTQQ